MLSALVVSVCLVLPAHSGVIDAFRAPTCERCAGNRGLELATRSGDVVAAGIDGEVSFAGLVGGRLYVVLRATADPRIRVTYGGLASTTLRTGDSIATGEQLGIATALLFVGLRIGDRHVDPSSYVSTNHAAAGADGSVSARARPRFPITLGRVGAHGYAHAPAPARACASSPSPR